MEMRDRTLLDGEGASYYKLTGLTVKSTEHRVSFLRHIWSVRQTTGPGPSSPTTCFQYKSIIYQNHFVG